MRITYNVSITNFNDITNAKLIVSFSKARQFMKVIPYNFPCILAASNWETVYKRLNKARPLRDISHK